MNINNQSMNRIIGAIQFQALFRWMDKPPTINNYVKLKSKKDGKNHFGIVINNCHIIPLNIDEIKKAIKDFEDSIK